MAPWEQPPLGRRTRSYGIGQLQVSPDVPDVPALNPGTLGQDTCRRPRPRAAPVVVWGGQVRGTRSKSAFQEGARSPLGRRPPELRVEDEVAPGMAVGLYA